MFSILSWNDGRTIQWPGQVKRGQRVYLIAEFRRAQHKIAIQHPKSSIATPLVRPMGLGDVSQRLDTFLWHP